MGMKLLTKVLTRGDGAGIKTQKAARFIPRRPFVRLHFQAALVDHQEKEKTTRTPILI
jgi:hypothetical protein